MTDRLSDLLAQRARQGSGVHPTRQGVDAVLARRATRRRRQRAVGSGLAAVFVLAGIAGGVALSADDDTSDPGLAADPPPASDLPLVGIDMIGFVRDPASDLAPADVASGLQYADITYAVFTAEDADPPGPLLTVATHPGLGQLMGTPVDLDGDGSVGDAGDGLLSTYPRGAAVVWAEDGLVTAVNGQDLTSEDVVAYAGRIRQEAPDLETLPPPDGLPDREVVTFGPEPSYASRVAAYRGPFTQGRTMTMQVLTTDEPGYFDLARIVSTEGMPYEEVPLGSSFLGPGVALVSADDDGPTSALIRTDAGLVVHITAEGLDAPVLRTAIETGHLVDLSVEQALTTTTAPAGPTTTIRPTPGHPPTPTTSIVPPTSELTLFGVERSLTDETETIELQFDNGIAAYRNLTLLERPAGECTDVAADFEEQWRVSRGTEPYWTGWLTLDLEAEASRWPTFDHGFDYIVCGYGPAPTTIAIPVESLGEPEVTSLSGRPILRIDLPR